MITTAIATNQQLARYLEQQRLLPADVLEKLTARARTLQEWLGEVAVDDGFLTYAEIAHAIAQELKLAEVDLRITSPDAKALARLPAETCRNHGIVPLAVGENILYLAMANPLDEAARTTLRGIVGCEIAVQVAPLDIILMTINLWYARFSAELASSRPPAPSISEPVTRPLGTAPSGSLPPPNMPPPGGQDSMMASPGTFLSDPNEVALDQLLMTMMESHASDLHLAVGSPPMMRVDGELRSMPFPVLKPASIQTMVYAVLTDEQITAFERHWELDFAYSLPGVSRFRVNVHRQRGSPGAVLRTIPAEMPRLEKLNMPPVVKELTMRPRGLVLITGPTGSGKSTTLAAMIDEINRTRSEHIVTIEDPIEFLHNNRMSIITQREVGADTEGFAIALRHVLRQDPDVILIGEMRDLETIAAAVTAAETGHLVFATLHTTSAAQTIERIIDVFPPHQQEQIRSQLSNVLEGILTQTLLPNIEGKGRSCAQEILICTPAIRNLIREGKVHQMSSVLQASAKYGMQTLDQALKYLVLNRKVSLEEAIKKSTNADDFKALVAMQ